MPIFDPTFGGPLHSALPYFQPCMGGVAAARPAAAAHLTGFLYLASDTGALSRCDGSTWTAISTGGGGSDGDKGDITISGSGTIYTIDNDVVTPAKMDNGAACSVLARAANSSGDRADISLADGDLLARVGATVAGYNPGDFTTGDLALTSYLLGGTSSTTRAYSMDRLAAFVDPTVTQFRLALSSSAALGVTTSDVTAATTIYWTPIGDNSKTAVWDGTRWIMTTSVQLQLLATASYTCTTTNGSAVLGPTGDITGLVRGMEVTGTGIQANTVISDLVGGSITMNKTATATSGGETITFKLPAGKNYDVFLTYVSGTLYLQLSNAWTSNTARADAYGFRDGVVVNNAAINSADSNAIAAKAGKYLGTIRTTATAGQCEDSVSKRFCWNLYNRARRHLYVTDGSNSWTYTTATWRSANFGVVGDANRVEFVIGLDLDGIDATIKTSAVSSTSVGVSAGIALDATNTNHAQLHGRGIGSSFGSQVSGYYKGYSGVGYHYLQWVEISEATGTTTWQGDAGLSYRSAGLSATILG